MRMCYEPSRHKFDLCYERIYKLNSTYKEWLEWEPKEKWVLCYDSGHRYGNMITNLS